MATIRKYPLVTNEVYHIFNRSIAKYTIFNNDAEFNRMRELFRYYMWENRRLRFSKWKELKTDTSSQDDLDGLNKLVIIIAYCVMPTHIHLVLQQRKDNGISVFMSQISNSYSRYFNVKYKRKGPLWEKEFNNVLVEDNEQLLHLTRYIHLNPSTAYLVDNPQEWPASSYGEYLGKVSKKDRICEFESIINISPSEYKEFVEDRVGYQRDLANIKHLLLESS